MDRPEGKILPTHSQKRLCWAALTGLSAATLLLLGAAAIFLVVRLVGFLQPVLLPFAIAGILAYLLEPVVAFFCRKGASRTVGTLIVFALFTLFAAGAMLSVVPTAWHQGREFIKNFPAYAQQVQTLGLNTLKAVENLQALPANEEGMADEEINFLTQSASGAIKSGIAWLQDNLPNLLTSFGLFLGRSAGGFLGAFGLIIGLVLIPVFLFYLLRDAPKIAQKWTAFLPLKSSPLKTEVASLLLEINSYIIAFFRGQVIVALIAGVLISIGLLIMGVDFAILIGILVATLGIIPYAGTILTWGPATLIAAAQFGDWTHPLLVTLLFLAVNQIDGFFITPYIVGDSVGLHPLTVMIAVLAWTVVLGGLLGALLAVPLTAALKVIARRYLWDPVAFRSVEAPP
jgi:predicted PurR-regulated permease PerM